MTTDATIVAAIRKRLHDLKRDADRLDRLLAADPVTPTMVRHAGSIVRELLDGITEIEQALRDREGKTP